jgi:hypothetical protein
MPVEPTSGYEFGLRWASAGRLRSISKPLQPKILLTLTYQSAIIQRGVLEGHIPLRFAHTFV